MTRISPTDFTQGTNTSTGTVLRTIVKLVMPFIVIPLLVVGVSWFVVEQENSQYKVHTDEMFVTSLSDVTDQLNTTDTPDFTLQRADPTGILQQFHAQPECRYAPEMDSIAVVDDPEYPQFNQIWDGSTTYKQRYTVVYDYTCTGSTQQFLLDFTLVGQHVSGTSGSHISQVYSFRPMNPQ